MREYLAARKYLRLQYTKDIVQTGYFDHVLSYSRLTPSFHTYSQGLADKITIIHEKAKGPWIILVKNLFQNVDMK